MTTDPTAPTLVCGYCGRSRTTSTCDCRSVQQSRETRAQEMEAQRAIQGTAYAAAPGRKVRSGQCR